MCGNLGFDPAEPPRDGATDAGAVSRCCPPPPWMPVALGQYALNIYERDPAGAAHVIKFFGMNRYGYDSASATSWCGSFVAWVLGQVGVNGTTVPERAMTWGRASEHADGWWPDGISIGRPIYGAIAVKSRSGGGHVTFVMGKDPANPAVLHCLGGNQSNRLNIARYEASVFSAFMVPRGYAHACCVLPDYTGVSEAAGSEA